MSNIVIAAGAVFIGWKIHTNQTLLSRVMHKENEEEMQRLARERATLDTLLHAQSDSDYADLRNNFHKLRDSETPLSEWLKDEHKLSDELTYIRRFLNKYELVALGINKDLLDKDLYEEWFKSSFVEDWNKCRGFINDLRQKTGKETFFMQFQTLAQKWGGN